MKKLHKLKKEARFKAVINGMNLLSPSFPLFFVGKPLLLLVDDFFSWGAIIDIIAALSLPTVAARC